MPADADLQAFRSDLRVLKDTRRYSAASLPGLRILKFYVVQVGEVGWNRKRANVAADSAYWDTKWCEAVRST